MLLDKKTCKCGPYMWVGDEWVEGGEGSKGTSQEGGWEARRGVGGEKRGSVASEGVGWV